MTYGGSAPTLTDTITGFVNNDTAAVVQGSATCDTTSTSSVGSYAITCDVSGLSAANYSFVSGSGTLTVNPAPLTVTANNQTMTYGGSAPALTGMVSGFVNGQDPSVVTGSPACTAADSSGNAVGPTTPAGAYTINCAQGTLTAPNYTFATFVTGTLTVNPAPLIVTADDQTMIVGGAVPTLTVSYAGFVNGDTTAVLSGSPACSATDATGNPVGAATPVGTYAITCAQGTLTAANYSFTFVPGVLSVTYGIDLRYDQGREDDSALPITLALTDASGNLVATQGITVTALCVAPAGQSACGSTDLLGQAFHHQGNGERGRDDRHGRDDRRALRDSYHYVLHLHDLGLAAGQYALLFSVTGDPVIHRAPFTVAPDHQQRHQEEDD